MLETYRIIFCLILISIIISISPIAIGQNPEGSAIREDIRSDDNAFEDIERSVSSGAIESTQVPATLEPTILPRTSTETILCLGILAFGLVLVFFTGYVVIKKGSGWDNDATRIFTTSLIVTAGLFLITAGYSDSQIAPMYGLLGTIVGYILGKSPIDGQVPK
jgi:hypothetical protein